MLPSQMLPSQTIPCINTGCHAHSVLQHTSKNDSHPHRSHSVIATITKSRVYAPFLCNTRGGATQTPQAGPVELAGASTEAVQMSGRAATMTITRPSHDLRATSPIHKTAWEQAPTPPPPVVLNTAFQ